MAATIKAIQLTPHWDRQRSDGDLGLIDQPNEMPNCKNAEKNAGDTQSSFW
jgi:hypothetical protein